ncbi:hypothetical protein NIES4102_05050 [Chondrocystis sp. NIES-4102]|nr:hypothetical protein NIES4102_05050 [Chondrocystis sp. NIES-4102]
MIIDKQKIKREINFIHQEFEKFTNNQKKTVTNVNCIDSNKYRLIFWFIFGFLGFMFLTMGLVKIILILSIQDIVLFGYTIICLIIMFMFFIILLSYHLLTNIVNNKNNIDNLCLINNDSLIAIEIANNTSKLAGLIYQNNFMNLVNHQQTLKDESKDNIQLLVISCIFFFCYITELKLDVLSRNISLSLGGVTFFTLLLSLTQFFLRPTTSKKLLLYKRFVSILDMAIKIDRSNYYLPDIKKQSNAQAEPEEI